jgi:hypothetical protein
MTGHQDTLTMKNRINNLVLIRILCFWVRVCMKLLTVLSVVVATNNRHCTGRTAYLKSVGASSGCRLSGREGNEIQSMKRIQLITSILLQHVVCQKYLTGLDRLVSFAR